MSQVEPVEDSQHQSQPLSDLLVAGGALIPGSLVAELVREDREAYPAEWLLQIQASLREQTEEQSGQALSASEEDPAVLVEWDCLRCQLEDSSLANLVQLPRHRCLTAGHQPMVTPPVVPKGY